ncbi:cobalt-zinc-cadmium efflux system protein [Haladaptatus litoreus]|uniref:Cobalt-zinc-cadmium efflux system protein n=1 Tax=Haladaptatus litoreus TaxID=553468 RepID=A0A1N6URH3_9EURY|nr:cation diffusion facilitator family transporter [Haladaptatus litoreus]SIQ68071.1 cobalt-zinc-cadmium efflux system protein [Haladaptatus litoreus]
MAHDHAGHDDADDSGDTSFRALAIALVINTIFFVVELVGALYSGSLTLLADAVHMLADSASLGLALFAAWISARPADARRTYGYQRAEVLGALGNGLLLLLAVGYVLFDSLQRFGNPQPIDAELVVIVGVLGLLANLAGAWVLSEHRGILNVEGAFLHLIADALGSVAAIAVGIALVFTDLYVLDPLFAVFVALLVLYSAKDLFSESLNILLQGTPAGIDVDEVRAYLTDLPGVVEAHDVHVWSLSSTQYTLSAHVVVEEEVDPDAVLRHCQQELGEQFGIDHATIQVESASYTHTLDFDCTFRSPKA